jgi:hypothetical protein
MRASALGARIQLLPNGKVSSMRGATSARPSRHEAAGIDREEGYGF